MNFKNRIKAAGRKNLPEIRALMTGTMPQFVYGGDVAVGTVPVFTFHEVTLKDFEEKLYYLHENCYSGLDGSELHDCLSHTKGNHSKKVVLAFDDGHISLWRNAFPLLKKYNFKAMAFICPGLVPETNGGESAKGVRKLCNWEEIKQMHDSGHVDFQSHSMYHDLVFTSSRLVDFFNPQFSSHYLGKQDKAVILSDKIGLSITNLWPYEEKSSENYYGMPIFEHAPRYATKKRVEPSGSVVGKMCDFVKKCGGTSFFEERGWRSRLKETFRSVYSEKKSISISGEGYLHEMTKNLSSSKEIIERELSGKKVRHICYPWFEATEASVSAASKSGHLMAFLGIDASFSSLRNISDGHLKTVQRTPDKWISLLPGKGRRSLFRFRGLNL